MKVGGFRGGGGGIKGNERESTPPKGNKGIFLIKK